MVSPRAALLALLATAALLLAVGTTHAEEAAPSGDDAVQPPALPQEGVAASRHGYSGGAAKPGTPGFVVPNKPIFDRLGLPMPPKKFNRRNFTKTADDVMFVQSASSAKVTRRRITLYDVAKGTTWFFPRPDTRNGVVPTDELIAMLHMRTEDRAINAVISYRPSSERERGASGIPRTVLVMLWGGNYDAAKKVLSYSWKPLGKESLLGERESSATLSFVALTLDNCPSNVPFICCTGDSCLVTGSGGCNWNDPTPTSYFWKSDNAAPTGTLQKFGCPGNYVGTVIDNACWDSHQHEETSSGSCVACQSTAVDDKCAQAFPAQCGGGACSNSWYPAYWPFFCGTPNLAPWYQGGWGGCICPGTDPAPNDVSPQCQWACGYGNVPGSFCSGN